MAYRHEHEPSASRRLPQLRRVGCARESPGNRPGGYTAYVYQTGPSYVQVRDHLAIRPSRSATEIV